MYLLRICVKWLFWFNNIDIAWLCIKRVNDFLVFTVDKSYNVRIHFIGGCFDGGYRDLFYEQTLAKAALVLVMVWRSNCINIKECIFEGNFPHGNTGNMK